MDKRYQVFISSTFADLQDERQAIMRALMQMDCIPAGMELFPAADEEQMQFIKKVIDDCDYYILLIGGRYGSVSEDGVSYTEQEYEYAKSKGLRVIALLHKTPDTIPVKNVERDPAAFKKLEDFRAKVSTNRLVQYWTSADQLPGIVALSLMQTIKTYPAVGWVRGDSIASEDLLRQINNIRLENESLRLNNKDTSLTHAVPNLAGLDESIEIFGKYDTDEVDAKAWKKIFKWREIFWHISPYLDQNLNDAALESSFTGSIKMTVNPNSYNFYIYDQSIQTILVQLRALNLAVYEAMEKPGSRRWKLSVAGQALMFEVRTAKSADTP